MSLWAVCVFMGCPKPDVWAFHVVVGSFCTRHMAVALIASGLGGGVVWQPVGEIKRKESEQRDTTFIVRRTVWASHFLGPPLRFSPQDPSVQPNRNGPHPS